MAINIAVFVSGSGSNAENLHHYFVHHPEASVCAFFCNNPQAFALERAERLGIPAILFTKEEFASVTFLEKLKSYRVDYMVLAGFLWKVPGYLIAAFPDRIINIHPALLPKYGGKGMYGSRVHEAVIKNNEKQSGITIHLVNENYDEGRILFQARCEVSAGETPGSLVEKVHELEYEYFPRVIAEYIRSGVPRKRINQ